MPRPVTITNRRQLLLDAAERLFVEKGYGATRMEDIAAEAGVSKGSVYLEFASKEALLMALIRHHKSQQIDDMQRRLDKASDDILGCLKAVLLDDILFVHGKVTGQQHSMETLPHTAAAVHAQSEDLFRGFESMVTGAFQRAYDAEALPALAEPTLATAQLLHALSGFYPPYMPNISTRPMGTMIARNDLHHHADAVLTWLMDGIRASKNNPPTPQERP